MLALKKYRKKNIAIYGMGITGRSVAKIFKKFKITTYNWDDSEKIRKNLKLHDYPLTKFWLSQESLILRPFKHSILTGRNYNQQSERFG